VPTSIILPNASSKKERNNTSKYSTRKSSHENRAKRFTSKYQRMKELNETCVYYSGISRVNHECFRISLFTSLICIEQG
jgi:hypothetical protein